MVETCKHHQRQHTTGATKGISACASPNPTRMLACKEHEADLACFGRENRGADGKNVRHHAPVACRALPAEVCEVLLPLIWPGHCQHQGCVRVSARDRWSRGRRTDREQCHVLGCALRFSTARRQTQRKGDNTKSEQDTSKRKRKKERTSERGRKPRAHDGDRGGDRGR
eukprot:3445025-Rhodomonas_salina.4